MASLTKEEARARARVARAQLTPERRVAAARGAARQLLAIEEVRAARSVLVYAPLPDELDPLLFAAPASAPGSAAGPTSASAAGLPARPQLVWPRVADRARGLLTVHACAQDELAPGSFGLLEPLASAPQVALRDIDVVLVPGLAFDSAGFRVGYGKGYYDRLLAGAPVTLITIGLCFEETYYPEIKHDDFDIGVSRVIVA